MSAAVANTGTADNGGQLKRRAPPQLKPWQPGQSGNPSGMPKGVAEVRQLARTHTEAAIRALAEICGDGEAPPSARVAAATALLDRGWGRPVQPVDINDARPLAEVPAEVLLRVLQQLAQAAPPVIEGEPDAG